MHTALHPRYHHNTRGSGKLQRQSSLTEDDTSRPTTTTSRRIFVVDAATRKRFLVDTGADLCVYPHRDLPQTAPRKSEFELFATNGTPIATFGTITLCLNLYLALHRGGRGPTNNRGRFPGGIQPARGRQEQAALRRDNPANRARTGRRVRAGQHTHDSGGQRISSPFRYVPRDHTP